MGYLHINSLYKDQNILMFKECYALEKIHGTSTHISYQHSSKSISFYSGGEPYEKFVNLFDQKTLIDAFNENFNSDVIVYGEGYGGKQQKMSHTYGKNLKFIVFDVQVDGKWLSVPNAEDVANKLGLEFVHYVRIPSTLEAIDAECKNNSIQAIRNGIGPGHIREGIVLRPIVEVALNNGNRVISKHKNKEFSETKTKREISPEQLKILTEANEIAEEWVTPMRLQHVLDKLPKDIKIENVSLVIKAMLEDVYREGQDEIVRTKESDKAIGKKCVILFKKYIYGDFDGDDNT